MKNPVSFTEGRFMSIFVFGLSMVLLLGGCGKKETQNPDTSDPAPGNQSAQPGGGDQPNNLGNLGEITSPKPSIPPAPQQPGTAITAPSKPDANEPPALSASDPVELAKDLPANAKYIPQDAVLALSVEPSQLLKKADHAKLIKTQPVASLLKELGNDMVNSLVANPEESGLAMDQPMHLYFRIKELGNGEEKFPLPIVGLVGGVKDEAKLEKLLNTVLQLTGDPVEITPAKNGGYRQIVVPGAPVALGFSKDTLIVAGVAAFEDMKEDILPENDEGEGVPGFPNDEKGESEEQDSASEDSDNCQVLGEGVPMPDGSQLLAEAFNVKKSLAGSQKKFKDHLESEYDLAAWINMEAIIKLVSQFMGEELDMLGLGMDSMMEKYLKDNLHSVHVSFKPGAAQLSWISHENAEAIGDASGTGMPKDMLDILPQTTIATLTESMNMAEMVKVIKDALKPLLQGEEGEMINALLQENLGMTLDELLSIPKGDFLLAFTGLQMQNIEDAGDVPMPQFILGLSVANQDNLGKLQAGLARQNALMMMNMVGIQIVNKKGRFYICSQGHVPAINAGQAANKLGGNARTTLEKNDYAGILRFAPISAIIQQLAEGDPDADLVIGVLNEFKQASLAGNFSKGRQDIIMRLDFKDPKTNGLRQLVDVVRRLAQEVDLDDLFGGGEAPDDGGFDHGFAIPSAKPNPKKKEELKRDN